MEEVKKFVIQKKVFIVDDTVLDKPYSEKIGFVVISGVETSSL